MVLNTYNIKNVWIYKKAIIRKLKLERDRQYNGQTKNESKDKQCFIEHHRNFVQHEPDNKLML